MDNVENNEHPVRIVYPAHHAPVDLPEEAHLPPETHEAAPVDLPEEVHTPAETHEVAPVDVETELEDRDYVKGGKRGWMAALGYALLCFVADEDSIVIPY